MHRVVVVVLVHSDHVGVRMHREPPGTARVEEGAAHEDEHQARPSARPQQHDKRLELMLIRRAAPTAAAAMPRAQRAELLPEQNGDRDDVAAEVLEEGEE